ncbi:hypothetical protein [Streptomyces goshikiensis]|uniref:hypothetical protein n=1 Tax=Streptomyces goshikiensis TaxID=1942 RepID=UPI003650B664
MRNEPVLVRELPALRQLLVLLPDQARFHWLDAHTWTVYALCEGVTLGSLAEQYRRTVRGPLGEGAARRITGRCLDLLLAAGLVSRAEGLGDHICRGTASTVVSGQSSASPRNACTSASSSDKSGAA